MPVSFCTMSRKVVVSAERTVMGGLLIALDRRLLTFLAPTPTAAFADKAAGAVGKVEPMLLLLLPFCRSGKNGLA